MKAELVDFADVTELLNDMSELTISGKFVLIERDEYLSLVVGKITDYPYHAHLVLEFCDLNEIASYWKHSPDAYEICDRGYVVSGGYFKFCTKVGSVLFSGASTAYGPYNERSLRETIKALPIFQTFKVIFK